MGALFGGNIMRSFILAAAAFALASPATAFAAPVIKAVFPTSAPITASNNFKTNLAAAGFTKYSAPITSLFLTGMAKITWSYMGSESGFKDTFNSVSIGSLSYTETSTGFDNKWHAPVVIGTQTYASATSLSGLLKFTSNYGLTAAPGSAGFAVFLKPGQASGTGYSTLYFGYDDERSNPDRDFDDLIVKAVVTAVPVPEPGTWLMLLSGFALVGSVLRRRRTSGVSVLS